MFRLDQFDYHIIFLFKMNPCYLIKNLYDIYDKYKTM